MTRSIDADELEEFFKGITITNTGRTRGEAIRAVYISEVLKAVYNGVMNLPTIDAVEVVRCKDCRYDRECKHEMIRKSKGGGVIYCPVEFCSEGKRKEE